MTDWGAAEQALRTWVVGASGLDTSRVYFDHQDGNAPDDAPFATLHIGDDQSIGLPERTSVVDLTKPADQQLQVTSKDVVTTVVEISFYTPGLTVGNATARQLASNVRASLGHQDFRGPLNDAGIGVLRCGPVRWIPDLNNRTKWEGRAVLEAEIVVRVAVTKGTGYIAQVIGTTTVTEGTKTETETFSVP